MGDIMEGSPNPFCFALRGPGTGCPWTLVKSGRSKNLIARIYKAETQETLNRSTGTDDLKEAKKWVMANLGTLFSLEATPRGGGNNSIKRLLSRHVEFIRQRQQAGEISESTLNGYAKCSRHFTKWFAIQGYEKLGDIDRTTLMHYGLQRINDDGMATSTVNLEIVYLRMWWKWLQDEEILSRPLGVNPVKQAVENRTSGMPFHGDDLQTIYKTLDEWVDAEGEEGMFGQKKSPYNKELFRLFIQLLDESGARQPEVLNRT